MGKILTRYLANIRLRIIYDVLFLCTAPMCSFTKSIFCPFHEPGTDSGSKNMRMAGFLLPQGGGGSPKPFIFNFIILKFGIKMCVTHKQVAYKFDMNTPMTRKRVAQD